MSGILMQRILHLHLYVLQMHPDGASCLYLFELKNSIFVLMLYLNLIKSIAYVYL